MPTGLYALIRFAYAEAIGREFSATLGGDQGILVGGYNGRGDDNVRYTDMPAVLLEPLFGSNPAHAEWIRSEAEQTRLARPATPKKAAAMKERGYSARMKRTSGGAWQPVAGCYRLENWYKKRRRGAAHCRE